MHENEISRIILDTSIKVHRAMGPGLLENVYETVLAYELKKRGLKVEQQKPLPVFYEEIQMSIGFRADLLVQNKVIVELKSVEKLVKKHFKITRNYLGLTDKRLAILINFNSALIKDDFHRIVNNL